MILPVPLPKKQRYLPITFFAGDPRRKPVRVSGSHAASVQLYVLIYGRDIHMSLYGRDIHMSLYGRDNHMSLYGRDNHYVSGVHLDSIEIATPFIHE